MIDAITRIVSASQKAKLVIPELVLPDHSEVELELHYENFLGAKGETSFVIQTASKA